MQKNKIIIISISIVILAIIFSIFLYLNKSGKLVLPLVINKKTEEQIKKQAEQEQAEKIKQQTLEYIQQREIFIKKEFDKCVEKKSKEKIDECFSEMAGLSSNEDWCDKINNDEMKKQCHNLFIFKRVTVEKKDAQTCFTLSEGFISSCLDGYFVGYKGLDECNQFKDEVKTRCLDMVSSNLAYQQGKVDDCNSISDKALKNNCQELVASKPQDSDNDGINDSLERSYGTNPFKADSDGDGFNDLEELKKGFNPLGEGKF